MMRFRVGTLASALLLTSACAGGQTVCRRDPITGSEQCQNVGSDYGEAAVTGGAAAASWAAVGCTVNGCTPPSFCNERTKQCESTPCGDDDDCGKGFTCDTTAHRCR